MSIFVVPAREGLYLWRLRIVQTPWFGVYLHRIYQADDDRALHDHPWPFVSFVLRGWYREVVPDHVCGVDGFGCRETRERTIRWFNAKHSWSLHRISHVSRSPIWTLVFVGKRLREWGFVDASGWTVWHKWLRARDGAA
jgi:hypothetical protein